MILSRMMADYHRLVAQYRHSFLRRLSMPAFAQRTSAVPAIHRPPHDLPTMAALAHAWRYGIWNAAHAGGCSWRCRCSRLEAGALPGGDDPALVGPATGIGGLTQAAMQVPLGLASGSRIVFR